MSAGVISCTPEEVALGNPIDPDELAARVSSGTAPAILDVRSRDEFAAGHIPGALNVPVDELSDELDSLTVSRDAELVVHCEVGGRAAAAIAMLEAAGFTGVAELAGHMQHWRAAELPAD